MTRLREETGTTLPELLIAVTVGFVVLAATLGLLDSTLRLSGGVMSKTDAMQRGRLAMDRVTQQLRSQVCLNLTTPAVVPGATADSVTFYSDFSSGAPGSTPDRRTLTFDPATGTIDEAVTAGSGPPGGPYDFSAAPRPNLILENAARKGAEPFLTYFAYEQTGTPARWEAAKVLPPPLDAAEAARVARIDVAFTSRPTRARDGRDGVVLEDRVSVRHADPNLTVPDPICV